MDKNTDSIEKHFKTLGFEISGILSETQTKDQIIYSGRYNLRPAILKMHSKANEKKAKRLFDEFETTKAIQDSAKLNNSRLNFLQVFLKGQFQEYDWIIREFVAGKSLSIAINKFTSLYFDSLGQIDQEFVDQPDYYINGIVRQLKNLQLLGKRDPQIFDQINTKRFIAGRISESYINELSQKLNIQSGNISSILKNQKSNCECLSVQDLTPRNILVSDNNEIYLYDFEWAGCDNHIFDVTFLWLYLWKFPNWQKKLLVLTINQPEDKNLFTFNLIRIIAICFGAVHSQQLDAKQMGQYRKHIWSRYLEAAGESFEAVMEVT